MKNKATKHIAEYLTGAEPLEIAKILDEIEYKYGQLSLESKYSDTDELAVHLFELRQLRNLMLKIGNSNSL